MLLLAQIVTGVVALIHVYIVLLETVLFQSRGRRVFGLTKEKADIVQPAMSNQGCYNGFLVAALAIGFLHPDAHIGHAFTVFGLACVAVAGIWGGVTVKRSILLMQLKHALGKHAFMEENVVYPALREAGDPEDADTLNHEHGYVKQFLYELTNLDKASPIFLDKVREFRALLQKHIAEEETEIFPPFHAKLSEAKNKAITTAANKEAFKLA